MAKIKMRFRKSEGKCVFQEQWKQKSMTLEFFLALDCLAISCIRIGVFE